MSTQSAVQRTSNTTLALIEEYKTCSERADSFSKLIWQLLTFLLTIGAGGIALVVQINLHNYQTFLLVCVSCAVIVALLNWWNDVANRWNTYINVYYARMRQLEKELGLWSNRSIDLLDDTQKGRRAADSLSEEERTQLAFLVGEEGLLNSHYSIKSIKPLRRRLVNTVLVAWIAATVSEAWQVYQAVCGTIACSQQTVLFQLLTPLTILLVIYFAFTFFPDPKATQQ